MKKNLFLLFRFDLNQNELDWKCVNWIIQLSCFIWPLYVTNTVLPLFSNWWGLQGYFQNFQQILTISPQTVLVNFLGGQTVINECLVKKRVFLFLIQHVLKKNPNKLLINTVSQSDYCIGTLQNEIEELIHACLSIPVRP